MSQPPYPYGYAPGTSGMQGVPSAAYPGAIPNQFGYTNAPPPMHNFTVPPPAYPNYSVQYPAPVNIHLPPPNFSYPPPYANYNYPSTSVQINPAPVSVIVNVPPAPYVDPGYSNYRNPCYPTTRPAPPSYESTRVPSNVQPVDMYKGAPGFRKERDKESRDGSRAELEPGNERDNLLRTWRKNYCSTSDEMKTRLQELYVNSGVTEKPIVRSTPGDKFYTREATNAYLIRGTERLQTLCDDFKRELIDRAVKNRPSVDNKVVSGCDKTGHVHHHHHHHHHDSDSSSSDSDDMDETSRIDHMMEELIKKQEHPDRLHKEMWHNDSGEMNDGPLCRCSLKARRSGIRHGIYAGEKSPPPCDMYANNHGKLYHYRITISPPTNFFTKTPTIINHDDHAFIFEGFSLFSHYPLRDWPRCRVIRFNIDYMVVWTEERFPENFCVRELDLFFDFLFYEILELVDFNTKARDDADGCNQFHFMPRFVREIEDGKEILSMCEVLRYLINSSGPLITRESLIDMFEMSSYAWQNFVDEVRGMIVTYPGKKPSSVRVDQLDRNIDEQTIYDLKYPDIVHFGFRPPQFSYAGNPEYQKAWRDYVKYRHLLANMSKPTYGDKRKLEQKEKQLHDMRSSSKFKRDVIVTISAEGFYRTGIMCDVVQHAMLIPVLVCHLRFHHSLDVLENDIAYQFTNRYLLQQALTHPSYRENFGTNSDHARNSLTNCGIRQPVYGDRRIHYLNNRKRGINTLINIMSRFGKKDETESSISHNERLEFLGDAVVEFLSTVHLFFMFPNLEEGGLATYRAAIVQNQHLAVLAAKLRLEQFMLYAHGSDLCHDLELKHAMANCYEALMGAIFLDGGIEVADRVFGKTLFQEFGFATDSLAHIWTNIQPHPLQAAEPDGDRHYINKSKVLQNLVEFEQLIGIEFTHIRLLARAFADRNLGYTNLTMGSNQRLELLGDTVLQLISSEYLYKHFPEHHEGHLSLLRSSLVNNRTQAVVCDDLELPRFILSKKPKSALKTKDKADLLEAFLGALYVDKGIKHCKTFCDVTFFPRLQYFIMNQGWNDPKSKLQQCCLTLRTMDGEEPDIPIYKVIECKGPTNTRVYTVAVYFRSARLAKANGHSIQQAEMNSAKKALKISHDLFPQLKYQERVIAKSLKRQKRRPDDINLDLSATEIRRRSESQSSVSSDSSSCADSELPRSYRTRNVTPPVESRSRKRRRS